MTSRCVVISKSEFKHDGCSQGILTEENLVGILETDGTDIIVMI